MKKSLKSGFLGPATVQQKSFIRCKDGVYVAVLFLVRTEFISNKFWNRKYRWNCCRTLEKNHKVDRFIHGISFKTISPVALLQRQVVSKYFQDFNFFNSKFYNPTNILLPVESRKIPIHLQQLQSKLQSKQYNQKIIAACVSVS